MQQNMANMSGYEITDCWPAVSVDVVETLSSPWTYGLNHYRVSFKARKGPHVFVNGGLTEKCLIKCILIC